MEYVIGISFILFPIRKSEKLEIGISEIRMGKVIPELEIFRSVDGIWKFLSNSLP